MSTLGDNIREARIRKGLSQTDLAKLLGYKDRSTIAKIETDKADVGQRKLKKIADALGTTPADLMGWTDETNPDHELQWYPPLQYWDRINNDRGLFINCFLKYWPNTVKDIKKTWNISASKPQDASNEEFQRFVVETVDYLRYYSDGPEWVLRLNDKYKRTTERETKPSGTFPFVSKAVNIDQQKIINAVLKALDSASGDEKQEAETIPHDLSPEKDLALLRLFHKLNAEGQQTAMERVGELTEIPKYKKDDKDK